ncbi:MAG: protein-glutamate methylesterase/protein-glutamine glutaminase, partial [Thermoanaerobaculia bacterium]
MRHVLIVDDSAVVRMTLGSILTAACDFTVESASDPLIAMRKMARRRPDVIVLDLEMPHMDGLTFLRRIMATDPIPVVICSGMATRESELGICALEEGAVDIIGKPKLGVRDFVVESAYDIVDVIRDAAGSRPRRMSAAIQFPRTPVKPGPLPEIRFTTDKIVAVAASTGGTEAIRTLLLGMPPDCPALVIVQHMPAAFTAAFAKRLNEVCRIVVKEAESGDKLASGRALIAPGNRHTLVRKSGAHYTVKICDTPVVNHHRPSADLLFRSVAEAAGPNAVGVVLTGMGDDGAAGLEEMRRSGAATIAQDEASCVVFGMPKKAIERGAVQDVVALPAMAEAVLRSVRR